MRLALAVACVVLAGCARPPSDGSIWVRQGIEQELVVGRLTEAQRAATAHGFEVALVDETLNQEAARLEAALTSCPGAQRELSLSPADQVRDGIRVRIGTDPARSARVAAQALADWHLRRAAANGSDQQCALARSALAGTTVQSASPDVLGQLGQATVTRAINYPGDVTESTSPSEALSQYALGWTDTVRAASPLSEYLVAVYGGRLLFDTPLPATLRSTTPEELVDQLAPAYPAWEPDAIYQALTSR